MTESALNFRPLNLGRWVIWGFTALLFLVLPAFFSKGFALTLMSQMGITIIFVIIIVGGLGSLAGAFVAALLIGLLENFGKAEDWSAASLLTNLGLHIGPETPGYAVLKLTVSQVTPVLPYLLLVLILIVRPKGLLGTRED